MPFTLLRVTSRTLFTGSTALVGLDILTVEVRRSHSDTPQSVGLLWTSDQSNAETSTSQHTTLTRQTSMPPARFESAIPASERTHTYALDRGHRHRRYALSADNKLLRYQPSARPPNVACTTQCSKNFITQKKILGLQVMILFHVFNHAFIAHRSFIT